MHNGALACGDFRGKTTSPSYFRFTAPGKNLEPAQNAKSESNLMECIHAGVMRLSIE